MKFETILLKTLFRIVHEENVHWPCIDLEPKKDYGSLDRI